MIGIDKIPLEKLTEGEDGSFAYLDKNDKPIMIISKGQYANGEKINQLIDAVRELQGIISKYEMK
jgi:hypothetical protein